MTAVT